MSTNIIHGVALAIAGNGILIVGPSGSGKSSLALDLIDHCLVRNIEAHLVADDRVVLTRQKDIWLASAPGPLKGLVEVHGSGIHSINFLPQTQLHLAVQLVEEAAVLRMPDSEPQEIISGVFLCCLFLPQRNYAALRAVLAHLGLYAGVNSLRQSY